VAVIALTAGTALRFVRLDRIPGPVFPDEAPDRSGPAAGRAVVHFRDAIRPPHFMGLHHGGVLFLAVSMASINLGRPPDRFPAS
jgi:hypothetical protein